MKILTGRQIADPVIKHFEGCHLVSYVFPRERQATIGWGHAIPLAKHPMSITQKYADDLLGMDIDVRLAELKRQIGEVVFNKLTAGQLGAALSFKYNCKKTSFDNSTFLRLLKAGRISEAGHELKRWCYGSGVKLEGLARRRKVEEALWFGATLDDIKKANWYIKSKLMEDQEPRVLYAELAPGMAA